MTNVRPLLFILVGFDELLIARTNVLRNILGFAIELYEPLKVFISHGVFL